MNLLTDTTPDYLTVGGETVKIQTDLSVWVKFLITTENGDADAIMNILDDIFFGKVPTNIEPKMLIKGIQDWLWQCENNAFNNSKPTEGKDAFDFEADGNVIFCELWEHFPHLMERGVSFPQGLELIKLLISNEDTVLHHRAFARCGDFSKMDKDMRAYWQKEHHKYRIKKQDNTEVLSEAFM